MCRRTVVCEGMVCGGRVSSVDGVLSRGMVCGSVYWLHETFVASFSGLIFCVKRVSCCLCNKSSSNS